MSTSTTVQLRVDSSTKTKAQKLFKELGLDMSTAVKMFLTKVISTRSIPFEITTANGLTTAQERRIRKETEWAEKHGKKYPSARAMIDDMMR